MVMKMLKKPNKFQLGFTLVELLVVMAILGILTVITLGNFRTSQIKARDAQRKSDLRQIANALEAYYNDHSGYPLGVTSGSDNGKMLACVCEEGDEPCDWDTEVGNREFCDANSTVYMSKIPGDPVSSTDFPYCYESADGSDYKIYAKLENENDPDAKLDVTCGGTSHYNFGISSANTVPNPTPTP
jgi:prepilin-type N-terminal cleavage/methylation domain-containing protein